MILAIDILPLCGITGVVTCRANAQMDSKIKSFLFYLSLNNIATLKLGNIQIYSVIRIFCHADDA